MDLSELNQFEQAAQQQGLKLSAAIRIGAKKRPQGFGPGYARRGDGTSCALQAGAEAVTGRLIVFTDECEAVLGISGTFAEKIWRRNDSDRMTREQIADWLESIGY